MKILKILEIDRNGRALIHSHSNSELVEAINEIQEFVQKDKSEYKRGWRDRDTQSDLEEMACKNCKHKDGESGSLTHCSYFEQFMPTEIGKCDIWESKKC